MAPPLPSPPSFHELPEELELAVLSFLHPSDLQPFAAASRRSRHLCSRPELWLSICLRHWGPLTSVRSWAPPGPGLYRALSLSSRLLGFWRLVGSGDFPPLLHLRWGPSSLLASVPSSPLPFLSLSADPSGRPILLSSSCPGLELRLVGDDILTLAEGSQTAGEEDVDTKEPAPNRLEVYQQLANRISPDRKQRRRRNKWWQRQERHCYVKIDNCHPTSARPLQGVWKGIGEDTKLRFYLITYLTSGEILCQQFTEPTEQVVSNLRPIFWTNDANFLEFPFPSQEITIYDGFMHSESSFQGVVTQILGISSEPDSGTPSRFLDFKGRLWQYEDGTCGFGFLESGYIVDLQPVAWDGHLPGAADNCEEDSHCL